MTKKKKAKKRASAAVKISAPAPFSPARAYGAMLARQVASEMTPARSRRKKAPR
jgi:hypothetical protein